MIKDENTKVTIIIPKKLRKLIEADAKYEDRSISNYICLLLKKHYKMKIDDDEK